jgi:hypothetical protein
MKIPSNLLGAMVLCATLGAVTSSCTSSKVVAQPTENSQIETSPIKIIGVKVQHLFCPRPDPCLMCGMG